MSEPERKRIGLLVPSSNTAVEDDFRRVLPETIGFHVARMWAANPITPANLETMNADIEPCIRHLKSADVDCVAYACTSGSFYGGRAFDRQVEGLMRNGAGGLPIVTTSGALIQALRVLGSTSIAVVTPYRDEINQRLVNFLTEYGMYVVSAAGRQYSGNAQISLDTPEVIAAFAAESASDRADCILLACTAWRALEAVPILEQQLGRPVVTANQATLWASMLAIGASPTSGGWGTLLSDHLHVAPILPSSLTGLSPSALDSMVHPGGG